MTPRRGVWITAALAIACATGPAAASPAEVVDADEHGEAGGPNQIGASPVGFAGFLRLNIGSYVVWYERRLAIHHGLRVAGDFIHVHQDSGDLQSHQWTFGGSVGYRYHLDPGSGLFLGGEVGYRRGYGHFGMAGQPDHASLRNRQWRFLPEIGLRLRHPRQSLSFVTRLAVGYGPYDVTASHAGPAGDSAARFSRDVLAATSIVLDLEASLSYSF